MPCKDEKAKELIYSFDELQDPADEEYLRNHVAGCQSCLERIEKLKQLDPILKQFLGDISRHHIDNRTLDQYVTSPTTLTEQEAGAIQLHLEMCDECQKVFEMLAECNNEIAAGLWDEPLVLLPEQEQTYQKTKQDIGAQLSEFFASRPQARMHEDRTFGTKMKALTLNVIKRQNLAWAAVIVVVVSSIAFLIYKSSNSPGHLRGTPDSPIQLVSPKNGEALSEPYTFRWEPVKEASEYSLIIKDVERPEAPVIQARHLTEPVYVLKENDVTKLRPGRQYQWEIVGITSSGKTIHSSIRIFTYQPK